MPAEILAQVQLPMDGDDIEWNGRVFRIGKQLGAGAFGRVYECIDEWGNNLVAKVLMPAGTYDDVKEHWQRELKNLRHFRHPNITYVHDAFEYKTTFYIILERCSVTLAEFLKGPHFLGEPLLLPIAHDVLQALDFIHSCNYVHKDLHAGNIFVAEMPSRSESAVMPNWVFKIGDFGISNLEGDIRSDGTIMAEWMMPPERLAPGEFGELGRSADIYHTGLLLLGLLTNTEPSFTYAQILAGEPRQTAENLASPYGKVIAKALRRNVAQRVPSAIQFWRKLLEV